MKALSVSKIVVGSVSDTEEVVQPEEIELFNAIVSAKPMSDGLTLIFLGGCSGQSGIAGSFSLL